VSISAHPWFKSFRRRGGALRAPLIAAGLGRFKKFADFHRIAISQDFLNSAKFAHEPIQGRAQLPAIRDRDVPPHFW